MIEIIMDCYIKWNCFEMAIQQGVLEKCERDFSDLFEEALNISRQIAPEIMENVSLSTLLSKSNEIIRRLKAEHTSLEQCIDIYHATETEVNALTDTLPLQIASFSGMLTQDNATASSLYTSSALLTVDSGMVLEDWLAALVHKQGNDTGQ
jgi:hypothetical protein